MRPVSEGRSGVDRHRHVADGITPRWVDPEPPHHGGRQPPALGRRPLGEVRPVDDLGPRFQERGRFPGAPGGAGPDHGDVLRESPGQGARLLLAALGRRVETLGIEVGERVDVAELVPPSDTAWHERDRTHIRWQSTVHFMGEGYWAWLIPLSSGFTSVGIVVDGDIHPFEAIHTEAQARAFLAEHEPEVAARLAEPPARDFRCYREYSYGAERVFSPDRWALVGEAGPFVDPFYPYSLFTTVLFPHFGLGRPQQAPLKLVARRR